MKQGTPDASGVTLLNVKSAVPQGAAEEGKERGQ